MHVNTRFAVAIHVLALVRIASGAPRGVAITSEQIAERVNTHPVVVRRILGSLREAGLVSSQPGPGGGWRLSRPASDITLRDVYRGLVAEPIFALPRGEPNAACPIGGHLPRILGSCFRDAELAMEWRLGQVTIADVIAAADREGWRGQPFQQEVAMAGAV